MRNFTKGKTFFGNSTSNETSTKRTFSVSRLHILQRLETGRRQPHHFREQRKQAHGRIPLQDYLAAQAPSGEGEGNHDTTDNEWQHLRYTTHQVFVEGTTKTLFSLDAVAAFAPLAAR